MVRHTFHTNARSISSRDINTIDHLLRRGRRQLEMYSDPGVKDCHVSEAMRQWEREVFQRK
jgi:succinate dehydrogenase assembly factor 1